MLGLQLWEVSKWIKQEKALCQIGLMSFTKGMGRDRQLFAISALFVISIQLNHSS